MKLIKYFIEQRYILLNTFTSSKYIYLILTEKERKKEVKGGERKREK